MKLKRIYGIIILSCCLNYPAVARPTMAYLPDPVNYDPAITMPETYLGFELGDWHSRPEQIHGYLQLLASESKRLSLQIMGYSFERRPTLLLTISSEQNQNNIEDIRQNHLNFQLQPKENMPAIVWMGFSVHGNEPSGSQASMLLAYYLAAARGDEIDKLLGNTVILIEPILNPDGLTRYSQWVNSYRNIQAPSINPQHNEHNEQWPSGRGNHYFFDLNRDWILLTQPESKSRIPFYQKWRPHILTDVHEMRRNNTYFFQPGIANRTNHLIPDQVYKLTDSIANYHRTALDKSGEAFYSHESYDDYYVGKGSTYPDINGSIGILFEQANTSGYMVKTKLTTLRFSQAIQNQFTTALSTLKASQHLKPDLQRHQYDFYHDAIKKGKKDKQKAYVIGHNSDPVRMNKMLDILLHHDINVYQLAKNVMAGGRIYKKNINAGNYIIPLEQRQYRLIKSLFEIKKSFNSNIFYDVSTWNMPVAFGLNYAALNKQFRKDLIGDKIESVQTPAYQDISVSQIAYVFSWQSLYAPQASYQLLDKHLKLQVATKPFTINTTNGEKSFSRGSIVIPVGIQEQKSDSVKNFLQNIQTQSQIKVYSITQGHATEGIDIGSPSMQALIKPKPLLLAGKGVSSTQMGEVWHLLDKEMHIPVVITDFSRLSSLTLHQYTHIIQVKGKYKKLTDGQKLQIQNWLNKGGIWFAADTAVKWLADQQLITQNIQSLKDLVTEQERINYNDIEQQQASRKINGVIMQSDLDITNPLAYGYQNRHLYSFRRNILLMEKSHNPYATIAQYTDEPLYSGFIAKDYQELLKHSAMLIVEKQGKGQYVLSMDNLQFRAHWYGTQKLLLNTLFFGHIINIPNIESNKDVKKS